MKTTPGTRAVHQPLLPPAPQDVDRLKANKNLVVIEKKSANQLQQTVLEAVHFVPLKSGIA